MWPHPGRRAVGEVGVILRSSQRALGAGHRQPRGSVAFAEVTRECWCGKSQALWPRASLWSHWVRNEEALPVGWLPGWDSLLASISV